VRADVNLREGAGRHGYGRPMDHTDLLVDAFGRIQESVHAAVDDLSAEQLAYQVDDDTNTISWLVWHLTRIIDDHVADVADIDQTWHVDGWAERFGLPFPRSDTGYGHTRHQVAAVRVDSPELLTGYHDAVHRQVLGFVRRVSQSDLDRIVDERWNPPVSLGVRLISVIDDGMQHAGQAAFVRGLVLRSGLTS
jgi:Protein of unknown function (DUF664)